MRYVNKNEVLVKERFAKDIERHEITVMHADGMYRHYRCQRPETWSMGFDIITWPGSLCYTGDMGDYLFQRTEDMVEFMRRSCMSYSYAAEKCVAHDGRLKEFSEDLFRWHLAERAAESEDGTYRMTRYGGMQTESIADKVAEILAEYNEYSNPFMAQKAMYESGMWDGCDLPSCDEYTVHFLWALHAIQWFCNKTPSLPGDK